MLLGRLRQSRGPYRLEKSEFQRRLAALTASLIPLWPLLLDSCAVEASGPNSLAAAARR